MFLGVSKKFYFFALVTSLFFVFFPDIDIFISSLFYSTEKGFFWSNNIFILFLYSIPRPIVILGIFALIILIIDLIFKKRLFNLQPLYLFFFVSVMLIGPGFVVHTVFKDTWGRARPVEIVTFNGTKTFTPAWIISDQCSTNCSFVSGHSAGTYSLIALALLAKRRKRLALLLSISIGSLVGLGRIIQGGHFFSDIFFSFIFVYLTAKVMYYFIFDKKLFDFIEERCKVN